MIITSRGYELNFVQIHPVKDSSDHLKTYVYKFLSPATKLLYILRAELHEKDFIAIKFYAKRDRGLDNKYSRIVNRGDVSNVLVTCAKAIPIIMKKHPGASFGFIGSRTIDSKANKVESHSNNQRFKIYKHHIPQIIGSSTFEHIAYEDASAYLLLNRSEPNLMEHEKFLKEMVVNTYENVLNVFA